MAVAQQTEPVGPDLTADEETHIFDDIRTRYDMALECYAEIRAQWLLNIHFAMGNQWVKILPHSSTVIPVGDVPKSRVREVVNLIRPRVRMYVATAASRDTNWKGTESSDDLYDEIAARKSSGILSMYAREWKLTQKKIRALKWAAWTGTGYFQPYYDEEAGRLDPVQGFRLDTPSPFDVLPEPAASSDEDCQWMFRVHLMHIKRAHLLHPDFAKDLIADRDFSLDAASVALLDSVQGSFTGRTSASDGRPKDRIVLLEYWELPSDEFPQGRRALLGGKRLIEYHDWPAAKLPIRPVYYEIVPGRYLGQSQVGGIIGQQKSFNRRLSAMLETLNYHSHPKLLVPRKAKILKSAWTTEPGEKVAYDFPFKPEVVPPVNLPSHAFRLLESQQGWMDSITNQPEAARGERVPGMRSGRGYALIQEKAAQSMQDTTVTLADALTDVGQYVMEHWQERVPQPVAVQYLGQDGDVETDIFYHSDVRKDIHVDVSDVEPESKETKEANIRNDLTQQIITPPEAKRALGYSTSRDRAYRTRHENCARRELYQIKNGVNPPVYPWHDQEIHFDIHGLDFVAKDFDTWPDAAKQAAWDHMQAHDAQMQQQPTAESGAPTPAGSGAPPVQPPNPGQSLSPNTQGVDVATENDLRNRMGM